MGGFVYGLGSCFGCKTPFHFNPHKVPSHRVNGVREPVCRKCMAVVNAQRKLLGHEPFVIDPEAYEAIPEAEL